jgi:hypothetical protein
MPKAKELKVKVENRAGVLGEITAALAAQKLNLRAAHGWAEGDVGYVRLVPEKPGPAKKALAKAGFAVEEREVLEVVLADKAGALAEVAGKLGRAGVNLEYLYVGSAGAARKVSVFLGVPDLVAASRAVR